MSKNSKTIKRKIASVNSTMQITKAMELVSTAKLRKTRQALDKAKPYFETIYNSVVEAIGSDKSLRHPFLEQKKQGAHLVIVITGDRGLCGGYNINAMKKAASIIENKQEDKIITIGSKAKEHFRLRNYNVLDSFVGFSEAPTLEDSYAVGSLVVDEFLKGTYAKVTLVFTEFRSTIDQVVQALPVLPFPVSKEEKQTNVIYEPSTSAVLDYLIPSYVNNTIYGGLMESAASEQASRRLAMENATTNAEDMIEDLGFAFNQARQAAITQELSEIVSGAEALK